MWILIGTYLISTLGTYLYINKAHSKEGVFEGVKLDKWDIFITFCPILNTMVNFSWILYYSKRSKKKNYNKFFLIK
jgi:hypothetical protein